MTSAIVFVGIGLAFGNVQAATSSRRAAEDCMVRKLHMVGEAEPPTHVGGGAAQVFGRSGLEDSDDVTTPTANRHLGRRLKQSIISSPPSSSEPSCSTPSSAASSSSSHPLPLYEDASAEVKLPRGFLKHYQNPYADAARVGKLVLSQRSSPDSFGGSETKNDILGTNAPAAVADQILQAVLPLRRIMGKQAPPKRLAAGAVSTPARHTASCLKPWEVNKRARRLYAGDVAKHRSSGTYMQAYKLAVGDSSAWSSLSDNERDEYVQVATDHLAASMAQTESSKCVSEAASDKSVEDDALFRSYGAMFTWNGPWLADSVVLSDLIQKFRGQPDELAAKVRDMPEAVALMDQFRQEMLKYKTSLYWPQMSCCLELSLKSEAGCRVHFHMFAEFADRTRNIINIRSVQFDNVLCGYFAPTLTLRGPKGRDRALREGHYYVQAPKIGNVMWRSTCPKFEVLMVSSDFIKRLWQQRKMTTAMAMQESILSRDRVPAMVQLLEKTRCLEYSLEAELSNVAAHALWKPAPFKPPTDEELSFLKQFACRYAEPCLALSWASKLCSGTDVTASLTMRRFKLLILDGLSRTGKTERALAFFGFENCLILNCQDTCTPCLRPFLGGRHTCIIYDEGSWELVSKNRALFQSSSRPTQLSQSQCNESAYTVQVFRVPMVVTSNNFWSGCKDATARDWIAKNSFYRWIDSPTWMETEVGMSASSL